MNIARKSSSHIDLWLYQVTPVPLFFCYRPVTVLGLVLLFVLLQSSDSVWTIPFICAATYQWQCLGGWIFIIIPSFILHCLEEQPPGLIFFFFYPFSETTRLSPNTAIWADPESTCRSASPGRLGQVDSGFTDFLNHAFKCTRTPSTWTKLNGDWLRICLRLHKGPVGCGPGLLL